MSDFWSTTVSPLTTNANRLPTNEQLPYLDLNGQTTNDPLLLPAGANTLFPLLDQTASAGEDAIFTNAFNAVDTQGTGTITKAQFEAAFPTLQLPPLATVQGADAIFSQLDPLNTGSVNLSTFKTKMTAISNNLAVTLNNTTPAQSVPADFNLSPDNLPPGDPNTGGFLAWHTDYQLQYYDLHKPVGGGALTIGTNTGTTITIIPSTPVGVEVNDANGNPTNTTTFVRRKVYILQELQKSDFATMSLADQTEIANSDYFKTTLADSLGLIPSNTALTQITPYLDPNATGANMPTAITTPVSVSAVLTAYPNGVGPNGFTDQKRADGTTYSVPNALSGPASVPVSDTTTARAAMNNAITGTEIQIVNDYAAAFHAVNGATIALNQTDTQVFINEIENIRSQINGDTKRGLIGQNVFSAQDIETSLTTIYTRWTRVKAFGSIKPESLPTAFKDEFKDVISQDGGASVANGYNTMMNAERRVLSLNNSALLASGTGVLANRHLDVPNLIAIFQLYSNLTDQQINLADTEEITQTNSLLTTYGTMQQIINQTLSKFDSTNTSQYLTLNGGAASGTNDDSGQTSPQLSTLGYTAAQLKVISMFEDFLGGQQHPIEAMNSIHRPNFNMLNNGTDAANHFLQQQWNTFGTELSDTVTLLNQNSQIKENNVTELQKEQDRHFDLANTALSKASDIVQSIGRNVAD